jgi:hypothetical protein
VAAVIRYRDRRQDEQRAGPNPLREVLVMSQDIPDGRTQ